MTLDNFSTISALPYGPSTLPIRKFLQRLAALSAPDEAKVVERFERLSATPDFRQAELALGVAIERSGRGREQAALAGPLLQLVKSRDTTPLEAASGDDGEALRPIAEPALSALLGLLMQDVLPPNNFAQLYAPFADAIPIGQLN